MLTFVALEEAVSGVLNLRDARSYQLRQLGNRNVLSE